MIREVEGLKAEGKELLLVRDEALLQARIEVFDTRSPDDIAIVLRGECAGSWRDERLGIEPEILVGGSR